VHDDILITVYNTLLPVNLSGSMTRNCSFQMKTNLLSPMKTCVNYWLNSFFS